MLSQIVNPLPSLESVFYRRLCDKASDFSYHNHFLQGQWLWYMKQPLQSKDIGKFRLTLMQGKRQGRLCGIRLHSNSDVTAVNMPSSNSNNVPAPYLINLRGFDSKGEEAMWQLAFQEEDTHISWLKALTAASHYLNSEEKQAEVDFLKDLARKMMENVDVRLRMHQFKIYQRTFVARKAVSWLAKACNCSSSAAINIGNRMLTACLIHHITHEHIFSEHQLLFQFNPCIDPLVVREEIDEAQHQRPQLIRKDSLQLLDIVHQAERNRIATDSRLKKLQEHCESLQQSLIQSQSIMKTQSEILRILDISISSLSITIIVAFLEFVTLKSISLVYVASVLLTVAVGYAILILQLGFGQYVRRERSTVYTSSLSLMPQGLNCVSPRETDDDTYDSDEESDDGTALLLNCNPQPSPTSRLRASRVGSLRLSSDGGSGNKSTSVRLIGAASSFPSSSGDSGTMTPSNLMSTDNTPVTSPRTGDIPADSSASVCSASNTSQRPKSFRKLSSKLWPLR